MVQVYELVDNFKGVSFSPFVILGQLLLKHKGIQFETIPLTFSEVGPTIKKVTNDEWALVPTIKFDNGDIVYDTPTIAKYLDEKYPENPLLNVDPKVSKIVQNYLATNGFNHFKLIILEIYNNFDEVNQKRWRETREQIIGQSIEEFAANPKLTTKVWIENTKALVEVLENQDFFDGSAPAINDYTIISNVQNLKTIAPAAYEAVIENHPNPALLKWVNRMNELFDGYLKARKTL